MLTKVNAVIFWSLWGHSCQFKPQKFSIDFWRSLVPTLWKRFRHSWMAPGARSKFGAPIFEPEVFQKQIYCFEESRLWHCWDFSARPADRIKHSRSDAAPRSVLIPGELCPLAPYRYAPGSCFQNVIPVYSGVRRKFPRGGKVSSQSCDVTNQLYGTCRRHDYSKGVRGHASGKILQNYT